MDEQGNNRHMQYRPYESELRNVSDLGFWIDIISDHCDTGTLVTAMKRVKAS